MIWNSIENEDAWMLTKILEYLNSWFHNNQLSQRKFYLKNFWFDAKRILSFNKRKKQSESKKLKNSCIWICYI